jgi:hypothetical protein
VIRKKKRLFFMRQRWFKERGFASDIASYSAERISPFGIHPLVDQSALRIRPFGIHPQCG